MTNLGRWWRRCRRRSARARLSRIEHQIGLRGSDEYEAVLLRPLADELEAVTLKLDALAVHLGVHFEYQDRPAIRVIPGPKPKNPISWEDV